MAKKIDPTAGKRQAAKPAKGPYAALTPLDWKIIAGILAWTIILFIPSLDNQFVNWDDDFNLGNNANTARLTWTNIGKIFSEPVIGNYNPLPILTFAIERAIAGLNPTVYHVDNLLLHLVCVFFAFRVLRGLQLNTWTAGAAALLFGIHPMRVESVAWVTERKDVLFGAFYLSALWLYIKYVHSKFKKKYFFGALLLFSVSLLAKIQAVSLPLTMLLVDYYFRRPLRPNLIIEKWLFFLLALIVGLVGIYFLREQGSIQDGTTYSLAERFLIGSYALGVYLVKFIYPYEMSPLYPYPGQLPAVVYVSPLVVLALAAFAAMAYRKDWRPYLFGLLFFVVNVMFVLQVVGAGQGFIADRFTYIPYLGLMFILAWGAQVLIAQTPARAVWMSCACGTWMMLLSWMTFRQNDVWQDSDALWTHVLGHYDRTPLPYRNRANFRRDQGRTEEALADYQMALSIKPDAALYNSRAKLFFTQKRYAEAMTDYNQAIAMDSLDGEMYINRGAVHLITGWRDRALADFTRGLQLDPDNANGYKNRSLAYQAYQQWDNAIGDIARYLSFHPEDADLWYEQGRLKNVLNRSEEALPDLDRAIRLNNRKGLYFYEKLKSLVFLGRLAEARQLVTTVNQLGIALEPEIEAKLNP